MTLARRNVGHNGQQARPNPHLASEMLGGEDGDGPAEASHRAATFIPVFILVLIVLIGFAAVGTAFAPLLAEQVPPPLPRSMAFHGRPWPSVASHGLPWPSTAFHGPCLTFSLMPPRRHLVAEQTEAMEDQIVRWSSRLQRNHPTIAPYAMPMTPPTC